MYPNAPLIKRQGEVDAWDNADFRAAVEASGKRQIVLAGIVTDVCKLPSPYLPHKYPEIPSSKLPHEGSRSNAIHQPTHPPLSHPFLLSPPLSPISPPSHPISHLPPYRHNLRGPLPPRRRLLRLGQRRSQRHHHPSHRRHREPPHAGRGRAVGEYVQYRVRFDARLEEWAGKCGGVAVVGSVSLLLSFGEGGRERELTGDVSRCLPAYGYVARGHGAAVQAGTIIPGEGPLIAV